jgi:hypothetical protein
VSTINGVFSLFLSSLCRVTFFPEGVIVGFQNFEWGFNSERKKIWDGNTNWGVHFLWVFLKKKEGLRIARNTEKIYQKMFLFFWPNPPPPPKKKKRSKKQKCRIASIWEKIDPKYVFVPPRGKK